MSGEGGLGAPHERDNLRPGPPTEEMFGGYGSRRFHPSKELPSGEPPRHEFAQEFHEHDVEGERFDKSEHGEYQQMESYRNIATKSRWDAEDQDEGYEHREDHYRPQGEQYQQEEEQYQEQNEQYGHPGELYGGKERDSDYHGQLEQFEQETNRRDAQGEWPFRKQEERHQKVRESRFDRGKEPQDQLYQNKPPHPSQQESVSHGLDDIFGRQGMEREPNKGLPSGSRSMKDGATISSLRKEPTVIPGLGGFEKEEAATAMPQSLSTKEDSKQASSENPNGNPANQMIESLGKIVSQLQTLQGLTSSLQLLQTLPKGQQEAGRAIVESVREASRGGGGDGEGGGGDRELSEETKRKVAALFASESDSDGEQVRIHTIRPQLYVPYHTHTHTHTHACTYTLPLV